MRVCRDHLGRRRERAIEYIPSDKTNWAMRSAETGEKVEYETDWYAHSTATSNVQDISNMGLMPGLGQKQDKKGDNLPMVFADKYFQFSNSLNYGPLTATTDLPHIFSRVVYVLRVEKGGVRQTKDGSHVSKNKFKLMPGKIHCDRIILLLSHIEDIAEGQLDEDGRHDKLSTISFTEFDRHGIKHEFQATSQDTSWMARHEQEIKAERQRRKTAPVPPAAVPVAPPMTPPKAPPPELDSAPASSSMSAPPVLPLVWKAPPAHNVPPPPPPPWRANSKSADDRSKDEMVD